MTTTTTTAPATRRARSLRAHARFAGDTLFRAGLAVARYGLAIVLVAIGGLKFTAAEAEGVRGLIEHSPLLSWMYALWSVQGASNAIGVVELVTAALIALRPLSSRAAAVGSALAVGTFLTTLSFMLTTPGVWDPHFPLLGSAGQFLVKDVVLLGAALLSLGEAAGEG